MKYLIRSLLEDCGAEVAHLSDTEAAMVQLHPVLPSPRGATAARLVYTERVPGANPGAGTNAED